MQGVEAMQKQLLIREKRSTLSHNSDAVCCESIVANPGEGIRPRFNLRFFSELSAQAYRTAGERAAERLEAKAAAFEDKKRALMELNEVIEQRRQQLIVEAMKVKKRFEPDRYEEMVRGTDRLLEAGGSA
eukprot:gene40632-49539_t